MDTNPDLTRKEVLGQGLYLVPLGQVPPGHAGQKVWLIDFETPILVQKAWLDAVSEMFEKSAASAAAKAKVKTRRWFSRR